MLIRSALSRIAVVALLSAAPASAEVVGNAVTVRPAAQTENPRGAVILARGGQVNAFDKVRTSVDGAVTLRFRDESMLDVGPGSVVTIDRFVYNPDNTARTAAITMTKGTFRWVSGRSPKEAYDLKTPATTLGIRGTDFTVIADLGSTIVELKSGAVRACSPVSGRCNEINRPGQGVRIWNDGRIEGFNPGTLMHQQVRRMAHHLRMPGQHRGAGGLPAPGAFRPPAQPATAMAAATGPQLQGQTRQSWTGSYQPAKGLDTMPKTLSALGMPSPGSSGMGNATLMRDHRAQMSKPIQSGAMVGGPMMGRGEMGQVRIQQPGLVERKGADKLPVIR